jgi:hypothetical protein
MDVEHHVTTMNTGTERGYLAHAHSLRLLTQFGSGGRQATFGSGNWGGRLPRGDLWCGNIGSGLQRARGHCPPHIAGPSTQPLVHDTRCALLTSVVTIFLSFFTQFGHWPSEALESNPLKLPTLRILSKGTYRNFSACIDTFDIMIFES